MSNATFPNSFLWGAATAAHQVEGQNTHSDMWVLEHLPDSIFAEPSGDACDHYHRYADDIALLATLGFNSYRFGIEWARVEPEPGCFSNAALAHYRRMLACCHEYGLLPMLSYNHFSLPRWVAVQGGWENSETVEHFVRYCEKVTEALGDLIGAACTLNEPNIAMMFACFRGQDLSVDRASGAPFLQEAARLCGSSTFRPFLMGHPLWSRDNLLVAHQRAVEVIRSGPGDFPVGWCLALQDYQAVEGGEARCAEIRRESQEVYLEASRNDDFVGVQTYSRTRFDENGMLGPEVGVPVTQMNYEFWPEALGATIRFAAETAGVPVYVTENGLASEDDSQRETYIQRALQSMQSAIADGVNVRGYYYWSAFDNFEWMLGYRPKFGLISVDRITQQRTIKPSALYLGNIAKANALT